MVADGVKNALLRLKAQADLGPALTDRTTNLSIDHDRSPIRAQDSSDAGLNMVLIRYYPLYLGMVERGAAALRGRAAPLLSANHDSRPAPPAAAVACDFKFDSADAARNLLLERYMVSGKVITAPLELVWSKKFRWIRCELTT